MGIKDLKIDSIDSLSYGTGNKMLPDTKVSIDDWDIKFKLGETDLFGGRIWKNMCLPYTTVKVDTIKNLFIKVQYEINMIYVDSKRNEVVIKWNDGTVSKGSCNVDSDFDIYEGFVVALVKRFFGSNSKIFDFIEEKLPGKQKHYVEECKKSWGYRDKRDKKNKKKKDVNDDVYTIIEDVCFAKADVAENTEGDSTDKEVETENLFCLFDE